MINDRGGTALVAGASSEIGAAVALVFARRGYRILFWGRDEARLSAAVRDCMAAGATDVETVIVDVRDELSVRVAAEAAAKDSSLRAVVWAAGTFQWGPFDEADPQAIGDVFATNLTAAAVVARITLPRLVRTAPSWLIFMGSGAGRQAFPNNAAYVAAKHGLRGLAQAIHLDVTNRDVRVALVSAGLVFAGSGRLAPAAQTHPQGLLRPDDIARTVEFVVDFPGNGRVTEISLQPAHIE